MDGVRDSLSALLLDTAVEGDVEAVAGPAAHVELPGTDPVVDGAIRDAECLGDLADGQLAVARPCGRVGNLVAPTDPLHVLGRERAAAARGYAGGVELLSDLRVGVRGRETASQLDRLRGGACGLGARLRSLDRVFLAGA